MTNPIFEKLSEKMRPTELARRLGVQPMIVSNWKKRGSIPAERVIPVETATGISRHDIRPDIYPLDGNYNNNEAA